MVQGNVMEELERPECWAGKSSEHTAEEGFKCHISPPESHTSPQGLLFVATLRHFIPF